jgi:hypothetical protein
VWLCYSAVQRVAVCYNVLQCVAVCGIMQGVAACYSIPGVAGVLQVCCSVMQCVQYVTRVLKVNTVCIRHVEGVLQDCDVLQRVAVCCSVVQCVA